MTGLLPSVAEKIAPMLQDMLADHGPNIHSFHIVGSAVIPDYNEKLSDVNSVVVLHDMDLRFIEFLAPLGREVRQKEDRRASGNDARVYPGFSRRLSRRVPRLQAAPPDGLRRGPLRRARTGQNAPAAAVRAGDQDQADRAAPGICVVAGQERTSLRSAGTAPSPGPCRSSGPSSCSSASEPPVARAEVIAAFTACCGIDSSILEELLALKNARLKPTEQDLHDMFERYYRSLETIGKIIDELR